MSEILAIVCQAQAGQDTSKNRASRGEKAPHDKAFINFVLISQPEQRKVLAEGLAGLL